MKWDFIRLIAIPLLTILCLATFASADQGRPGRLVTLDNKEFVFDSIMDRDIVKGRRNGSAISAPVDTITEITSFEAPKVYYCIMGLTRRNDGKKFVLHDAFMPADCNSSYITYTYQNSFTREILLANAAFEGLQKIIFEDVVR